MAANQKPVFALKPEIGKVAISTANTALDGSGTLSSALVTATTDGCKVTKIWYKSEATTTAGMIRIFISDSAGANFDLFDEMLVTAITVGSTTKSAEGYITYSDLELKEGQIIKVSTTNATAFNVFAQIGYFS